MTFNIYVTILQVKVIRWSLSDRIRLDSSLSTSWFAYEICLSVAVLSCAARFVTGMKIEPHINPKFIVKLKKLWQKGSNCYRRCMVIMLCQVGEFLKGTNGSWYEEVSDHKMARMSSDIKAQRKLWEHQWYCLNRSTYEYSNVCWDG